MFFLFENNVKCACPFTTINLIKNVLRNQGYYPYFAMFQEPIKPSYGRLVVLEHALSNRFPIYGYLKRSDDK